MAKKSLLITGASGGLASLVAENLKSAYEITGIDPRPLAKGRNFPGRFKKINYSHYAVADFFKAAKPKVLLHIGRVRATKHTTLNYRFHTNVLGTRHLLNLALQNNVEQVIILSTYHVYGAHKLNHHFLNEDQPLRAISTFPELADAVELDHSSTTFLWKNQQVKTTVLRPCLIVGKHVNNIITRMLRQEICPTLMGFDPPLQFLHENDLLKAIKICLRYKTRGIFNVAGEGVMTLSEALRILNHRPFPVPHFLAPLALNLSGYLAIPNHLVDYFRYPVTVSDAAFRKAFGYEPEYTIVQSIRELKT